MWLRNYLIVMVRVGGKWADAVGGHRVGSHVGGCARVSLDSRLLMDVSALRVDATAVFIYT